MSKKKKKKRGFLGFFCLIKIILIKRIILFAFLAMKMRPVFHFRRLVLSVMSHVSVFEWMHLQKSAISSRMQHRINLLVEKS